MVYTGKARKSVAPGVFQQSDRAAPSFVVKTTAEGSLLLSAMNTSRKVPLWEVALKALYGAIYALALLLTLGLSVLWTVAACRGRTKQQYFWVIRALPAMALCSLPLMLGTAAVIMSLDGSLAYIGAFSAASALIFMLSLWVPGSAVLALYVTLKRGREAKRGLRLLAWTSTTLTLIACAYLVRFGWLGLRTWQ